MPYHIPRVAAIHDLSGLGRAALTVVIPILSASGIQVCPLPTAVFSTHGAFPGYASADLTPFMRDCFAHWKALNLRFDAVYSGFLNAPQQIELIVKFLQDSRQTGQMVVIDPVLGDHGKLYGVTHPEMVAGMRGYIRYGDLLTPNLTEAALLLNEPYPSTLREDELRSWLVRLSDYGPNMVIITSVPDGDTLDRMAVIAYQQDRQQFWKVGYDVLPANFPGTGDLFTSVVVGRLLHDDTLPEAMTRAVQFVSQAIQVTLAQGSPVKEGVLLEAVLADL